MRFQILSRVLIHRCSTAPLLMAAALFFSPQTAGAGPAALLPLPAASVTHAGTFQVRSGARIIVPAGDDAADNAARHAAAIVTRTRGIALAVADAGTGQIAFVRTAGAKDDERYRLEVTADGIRIAASSDAGLFYGAMSLTQLLTPDARFGAGVEVPAMTIDDRPRFAWRGVMLDVARHMLPLASIERIIDMMAQHKLNRLQLHLTDDQGWRIEIKRHPELTRIGAWRTPPAAGGAASAARYGGFYTQAELRALVAYAAARSVTIVPEIDMPGHAQAAIAAYPQIGVLGDRPAVSGDWGINPYLFNVDDRGMAFVKDVLDEVMAVFPSTYIHVGGDEALKDQWQASPAVQAKMRALGIPDEQHLQSWFVGQLGAHLAKHGRRLIGWDEILEGGLPASASVMSWRGEKGAIEAANLGHDVVLSPGPTLYLDNLQSRRGDEPPGRLAVQTLADVYAYDPLPGAIDASKAHHVLGAQANLWSEYLVTPAQVEHALFPRIAALAEISWSPKVARDWTGFLVRLDPQLERYRRQGVTAADSAFAVDFAVEKGVGPALRRGTASVALTTQANYGTIRYTVDGKGPSAASPVYRAPLSLRIGQTVQAARFAPDGRILGGTRRFETGRNALLTRDSAGLDICPGGGIRLRMPLTPDALGGGPAYNMNIFDPCWLYRAAPLDLATGIAVRVGRLPRNFALRQPQREAVVWRYNPTRFGALMVRAGACDGPVIATLPLPDPARADNRLTLAGPLGVTTGPPDRDLCLTFTPPVGGPIYGIESVRLTTGHDAPTTKDMAHDR